MRAVALVALVLLTTFAVAGCARVRPWQRERLAGPAMQFQMRRSPTGSAIRSSRSPRAAPSPARGRAAPAPAADAIECAAVARSVAAGRRAAPARAPRGGRADALVERRAVGDRAAAGRGATAGRSPPAASSPKLETEVGAAVAVGVDRRRPPRAVHRQRPDQRLSRARRDEPAAFAHWNFAANVSVDVVSSSSVDVRSSPGLSKVDVTTSASGQHVDLGRQHDRPPHRRQLVGSGWHDANGHSLNFPARTPTSATTTASTAASTAPSTSSSA